MPCSTSPMDTPTASSPWTKFAVPSSGSTSHSVVGPLTTAFLAVHRDTGALHEDLADRGLAREVGGADPVARRLLAHLARRAEVCGDDFATGLAPRYARPRAARRGRVRSCDGSFQDAGELGRARRRRCADARSASVVTSGWSCASNTVAPASCTRAAHPSSPTVASRSRCRHALRSHRPQPRTARAHRTRGAVLLPRQRRHRRPRDADHGVLDTRDRDARSRTPSRYAPPSRTAIVRTRRPGSRPASTRRPSASIAAMDVAQ